MTKKNILKEKNANFCLFDLLSLEENLWWQKSHVKWTSEGDRCTKCFFLSTTICSHRNVIPFVKNGQGTWLYYIVDIKTALTQKFQSPISSKGSSYPSDLDGLILSKVDRNYFPSLLTIPSNEEIKDVFFGMDPNKAPRPNGMPGLFFRNYWPIMKSDVFSAVWDFSHQVLFCQS